MAKPNYSYENRPRELAKQRKKVEKLTKKAQRNGHEAAADAHQQPQKDALDLMPNAAGRRL